MYMRHIPNGFRDRVISLYSSKIDYNVTCEGFVWLIITGSGLDHWIYWHFDYNYSQLWELTINGCLRLAPFLRNVFSFTVTDLVLIYESVTSSSSVVRLLTLHNWTLNSLTTDLRLSYECRMIDLSWTELNPRMTAPLRLKSELVYNFRENRT
jgi:hypothetical protein